MIRMWRHPSWRDLNRVADGELEGPDRASVRRHLANCHRCAREVAFLRELTEAGREVRHPEPPRGLLDEVLRDREEGTRIILPAVSGPKPQLNRRLRVATVAAVTILVAGVATMLATSDAGAGASELHVEPVQPTPGQEVRLRYRPGSELAGQAQLRLRLRIRKPDSEPPRGTLGAYDEVLLVPDGDGGYEGSYILPDDFAFGLMSVEDPGGTVLDDRGGRLWTLRAFDERGLPLPEALRQEFLVLQNRSWPEGWATLHEMTVLYPELAEGWSLLMLHEQSSWLPGEDALARAGYRERFRILQRKEADGTLGARETEARVRFAGALEDDEALTYWLGRLEAVDPANRLLLTMRRAGLWGSAETAEPYLEHLWSAEDTRTESVCDAGFRQATFDGNGEAARRWARRCLGVIEGLEPAREMAMALLSNPETATEGEEAIGTLIEELEDPSEDRRPLDLSVAEYESELRRLRASLRIELARQLLGSGEPAAAIPELDAADSSGIWNPEIYRLRLEARLEVADTAGARLDYLRLEADPVYPRASLDSLGRRLRWDSRDADPGIRRNVEAELIARVGREMEGNRSLPDLPLLEPGGGRLSASSLARGRPTVLLSWDRRIPSDSDPVTEVLRARDILSRGDGQLLWITEEPLSESLDAYRRGRGLLLPVYQDPGSELTQTLGAWRGSMTCFVIDRAGTIRARSYSLMEAVRQLEVIEMRLRHTT